MSRIEPGSPAHPNCGCRAPASRRPAAWRTSTGRRPSPSTAGSWTPSSPWSFLDKHEHVLLVGPAGVGKSFLGQALGYTAIRAGHTVRFVHADDIFRAVAQAPGGQLGGAGLQVLPGS